MRRLPALILALACTGAAAVHAAPMKLSDYMALTGPAPSATFRYGSAPSQYAELFLPPGKGPFPVAVLVHGGCWTKEFGGIRQFRNMAGALAARGIASWNVEYRRVDEDGGGYPGMYLDMDAALDTLRQAAHDHPLDLARVARYVEHATMADQRIVPLDEVDAETTPYFSMVLVHKRGEAWR